MQLRPRGDEMMLKKRKEGNTDETGDRAHVMCSSKVTTVKSHKSLEVFPLSNRFILDVLQYDHILHSRRSC